MTLSKHKIKKIKELLQQGDSYREIREKTGASFDKIAQIKFGRLSKQSSASSTVATPPDNYPENPKTQAEKATLQNTSSANEKKQQIIPQESLTLQTNQIVNQLLIALEKNPKSLANNNHGTDYQLLEERINQLEQAKQTQEPITNLHLEKPYDEREADYLKSQQIQSNVQSPNVSDFQQPPKTNINQTIVVPQNLENERPDFLDYLYDSSPGFFFTIFKNYPALKKAVNDLFTQWNTLKSLNSNYTRYLPEKTKKPISCNELIPLFIPNSTSPPKTNKEPANSIPLGREESIQTSPPLQKTNIDGNINNKSDSNQHSND